MARDRHALREDTRRSLALRRRSGSRCVIATTRSSRHSGRHHRHHGLVSSEGPRPGHGLAIMLCRDLALPQGLLETFEKGEVWGVG
jgi:hypothetical protein